MAVDVGEWGLFHQNLDFMYKPHFMYKAGVALKLPYPKTERNHMTSEVDGFGIMREAKAAKPKSFCTGDRCFAYNQAQM